MTLNPDGSTHWPVLVLADGAPLIPCGRAGCDGDATEDHLCPAYSNPGDEMNYGNTCHCCRPCVESCMKDRDDSNE